MVSEWQDGNTAGAAQWSLAELLLPEFMGQNGPSPFSEPLINVLPPRFLLLGRHLFSSILNYGFALLKVSTDFWIAADEISLNGILNNPTVPFWCLLIPSAGFYCNGIIMVENEDILWSGVRWFLGYWGRTVSLWRTSVPQLITTAQQLCNQSTLL